MIDFRDDQPDLQRYLDHATPRDVAGQTALLLEMIERTYSRRSMGGRRRSCLVLVVRVVLEVWLHVTYRDSKR